MELESKQLRPLLKKALCLFMTALMLFSSLGGTFSVFAADGESAQSYTEDVLTITSGETKTIEVYGNNEITILKFVPVVSGDYTFYSTASKDTVGHLFDADREVMAEDDDGGEGYNFSITRYLEKGNTYYFGAMYYDNTAGSFDVHLKCTEAYCSHENVTVYEATEPSCEADGRTEGEFCNDCQLWLVKSEVIYAVHPDENDDFACDECGYEFSVVAKGICGYQWKYNEDGEYLVTNNAEFTLYDNGTLVIEGEGTIGISYGDYPYFAQTETDGWGNTYVNDNFIKEIIIREGITGIERDLFKNLHALTSVKLPSSLENIHYDAFAACEKLKEIYIPENVMNIEYAFSQCSSLERFIVDENNETYYNDEYGVLYRHYSDSDDKALCFFPLAAQIESYTVAEDVIYIEPYDNLPYALKEITVLNPSAYIVLMNTCSLETIRGYKYSDAEKTAENNNLNFIPLDDVVLESISIYTLPANLKYARQEHVGEDGGYLYTDGLGISLNFTDGTSRVVKRGFYCSGYDLSKEGKQDVTVTYDSFTTSFEIEVIGKVAADLPLDTEIEFPVYNSGIAFSEVFFTPKKPGTYRFTFTGANLDVSFFDSENSSWGFSCYEGNDSFTMELNEVKTYRIVLGSYSIGDEPVTVTAKAECLRADCDHNDTTLVPGFDATCTDDGLTDSIKCNECSMWVAKQTVIPSGHIDEDGDLVCDREGCGYEITVVSEGYCGEEYEEDCYKKDNARYTLYSTGLLLIEGEGKIGMGETGYDCIGSMLTDTLGDDYDVKEIVIGEGITTIGNCMFTSMPSLRSVSLPESLDCIEGEVFSYCINLTELYIPVNVKSLSYSAFDFCENLRTIKGYRYSEASNLANNCGYDFVALDTSEITGIEIETLPRQTEFLLNGSGFDHSGLEIRINYADGSYRVVDKYFSIDYVDVSVSGEHTVNVYLDKFSTSYTVNVIEYVPPVLTTGETTEMIINAFDNYGMYYTPAKDGTYRIVIEADPHVNLKYAKASDYESDEWDWSWECEDWIYGSLSWTVELQGGVMYYFCAYSHESNTTIRITPECIKADCSHENTTLVPGNDATCTDDGKTDGVKCNECSMWLEKPTVILSGHIDEDSNLVCDRADCGHEFSVLAEGYCGYACEYDEEEDDEYIRTDKAEYTLYDTGLLVIEGEGRIGFYDGGFNTLLGEALGDAYTSDFVKKVIIGEGITQINYDVFRDLSGLRYVKLPESLQSIDWYAFAFCNELREIYIPSGVTYINWEAFYECVNLRTVKGYRLTDASRFAEERGLEFVVMDEVEITGIEIDTLPRRTEFRLNGSGFNYDGLKLKVNYADGTSRVIDRYFTVSSDVDISVEGEYDVVVTAGEFSTSYTVTVYEYVIPEIELNTTKEFTGGWDEPAEFYFTPAKTGTYSFKMNSSCYTDFYFGEAENGCDWITDFYGNRTYELELQGGVKYMFRAGFEDSYATFRVTAECLYAECDHTDTTSYEAEEATCTKTGYTAGVKCNECTLWIEGHEKVTVPHIDDDSDNICDVCENSMSDIAVGETKTIDIISNEITYLKFIPSESGTYTFYAFSEEDTYGYIFDENKEELRSDDDYMRSDFYVSYYLEAGETYYLGARYYDEGREGTFDVSLYFGDRSDLSGWDDDDDWEDDWWDYVYENGFEAERVSDGNVCVIRDMTDANHKAYANDGALVIPDTIEGYPVVGFASGKLQDYDNDLKSITFPATVQSIPYYAFTDNGFEKLEEIIVDENNTTYKSIDGVLYNADATEILAVPRAYKGVLTIPATVQNVDSIVLVGVNGITDIVYEGEQGVVFEGNVLYNADKTRIIKAFNLKGTYEMPESVTEIEWYAFADLDELKEVKFSPNVTDITYYTFYDCDALEEVVTPAALQSIGRSAFEGCDSLKKVELNEGLTEIGVRAFNSSAVEKITIPSTVTDNRGSSFADCVNLKEVNLGSGMTYVSYSMFSGCTALEEITIPANITDIYWGAFEGTGLKKIEIPDSVTNIDGDAFSNCDSMKSAVIGNGVIDMCEVFRGCDALEKVVLGKSIRYYDSAFYGCNSLKEVVFPEGFNGYGEDAFSSCENLADVSLPESVQAIAYGQFSNCNSLEEFDLPEKIQRVHAHAFDDTKWYEEQEDGDIYFDDALYTYKGVMPEAHELVVKEGTKLIADSAYENEFNLSLIDLPDGLKYIGNWAFENSGVKSVIVPESLERVGYGAFDDCYDLTDVYYAGTEEQWSAIEIQDYNYHLTSGNIHFEYSHCRHENTQEVEATSDTCGKPGYTAGVLCTDCDEYISGHKAIGLEHKDADFNGECDVCLATAQEVFYGDANIVYIGKGETRYLKFVPERTMMYVLIAENRHVDTIKVLNDKYELITTLYDEHGSVRKPVDLVEGETYYFAVGYDTEAYKGEFYFNIFNCYYGYEDGYDYCVSDGNVTIEHRYNDNVKELIIPDSFDNYPVTELGYGAFSSHYRTEKIEIPENVTRIIYNSFNGCYSLEEVYLPSTVESIWSYAFNECNKLTDVYYNGTMEEFKNIRVEHWNEALLNANIHCLDGDFEVTFTEGDFTYRVNFMGNNGTVSVIGYNGNGGDVVIPENVRDYDVAEISSEAFANGAGITSIAIPSTITRMHYGAFENCPDIDRVYITDIAKWCDIFVDYETATPLSMDADLYLNGELLTDVIIPEGVTHISNYAFYGCTSIKTVEIPESVTYIGWHSFNYCDNLTDVYYRGDEDMWNDIDISETNISLRNAEIHFMSGHDHSFEEETVAPTCDGEGYVLHTCTFCGYNYSEYTEGALGHDYQADVIAPDCENEGYTVYTCSRCGDTYTENFVDASGHDYEAVVTAPTCQAGGYTTYTCKVCGNGYSADFTDSIDHNYESVVTPPTCEEIGFTTHTCTMCGDVIENEGVDSLGHDMQKTADRVEPTCKEAGKEAVYTCARGCGKTEGGAVIEKLAHTEIIDKAVAATCTETGLTAGKHCSVCGKVTVAQTETKALGHDKVSHAAKAATCTEAGWKAYETCKRCSYTTYKAVKALGHSYPDDFNIVYDASYKTSGVKMKGCTRKGCDATTERTEIPRLTLSKVKNLKATPDAKSIKFTWNKVKGAEIYEVQYSTDGKKWSKVKSTKNSVTIKKLKAGTTYKVKVKAVAGTNNGSFSSVLTTSTEPAKVTVSKVASTKSKQITVNWKKISGVTGFEVQYSTAKNFKKNTKTVIIKKQSTVKTTLKKLTKGKKYYIRVRAYKTVNKAKIVGAWSSVKSIKSK